MIEIYLVVAVLMASITAYALFGGADFGAGLWDLAAGRGEEADAARTLVDRSIGPVWEANHVWLIFGLVVLWTAFSTVFAAVMRTLFVPLSLAAIGILVRGSSFAFHKSALRMRNRRAFGGIFALSSVVVPFCMGAAAGAVGSGRAHTGDSWESWLNATSLASGTLAVAMCAYLAAVYLVVEARRGDEPGLHAYFKRRALISAGVVAVILACTVVVLRQDAPLLYAGLLGRALPLVAVSMLCGVASPLLLVRGADRGARVAAAGAVAAVVCAWGGAQWPFILPGSLTVAEAAAPSGTLRGLLIVSVLAAVVILPALGLLFALHQRSLVEIEDEELPAL